MIKLPQDLSEIQKNWDDLGNRDPFYAIASKKGKKDGKWDKQEFFQTGIDEIEYIMKEIKQLNIKISHTRALDFGCGVGRITQPLLTYFDNVDGVDISPSMIEIANSYNKCEDKIHYYLNNKNSLGIFKNGTYDFIYSTEVLQHMHPQYQEDYLLEFLRILSPDGLLVFQLPSRCLGIIKKLQLIFQDYKFINNTYYYLRNNPLFAQMQYYPNLRKNVESFLLTHGAKNVYAIRDSRFSLISYIYFVTKY